MIKIERMETFGWEHAIRGMRNPMNSWEKSDSIFYNTIDVDTSEYPAQFKLGDADLILMRQLYKGGSEHRKFMRMITVMMDITAPLYWWKEFDTYKIGTVSNSCSTMHKIHAKEFVRGDFSAEHLITDEWFESVQYDAIPLITPNTIMDIIIEQLNNYRKKFLKTGDKKYWWQMIQLLPTSYNQKRTIGITYETAVSIIRQRTGHKLDEWNDLTYILCNDLPYLKDLLEREQNDC